MSGDGESLAEARVDRASASIDAVLVAHGATCGVFVTAWNPRSVVQPATANQEAHERLLRDLDRRGARFLPHVGVGADPTWTEPGAFVVDLGIAEALALAAAYGQNAIVAVTIGEPAELILTDLMTGRTVPP